MSDNEILREARSIGYFHRREQQERAAAAAAGHAKARQAHEAMAERYHVLAASPATPEA